MGNHLVVITAYFPAVMTLFLSALQTSIKEKIMESLFQILGRFTSKESVTAEVCLDLHRNLS